MRLPHAGRLIGTGWSKDPPAPITGRLVDISDESTRATAVEVKITSFTPRPGTPHGACTVSDYQLISPRMPVEQTIAPRRATPFDGASIEFINKTSNHDACPGATIHLF